MMNFQGKNLQGANSANTTHARQTATNTACSKTLDSSAHTNHTAHINHVTPAKRALSACALIAATFAPLSAFDIKYNGWLESFSKVGFVDNGIDENLGKYPTDSFTTMIGSFGIDGNILSKENAKHKMTYGLSVTAGGLVLDSTDSRFPLGRDSVNNEYVGNWSGYKGDLPYGQQRRLYVINNAYIDYKLGDFSSDAFSFQFKGGRYESGAEYMSGFTQGFEFAARFRFSDSQALKLWWFSSYGRAFASGQWMVDLYSPRGYRTGAGRFANYGIHAFKATYSIGGLDVIPFIYFSPGTYTAPALQLRYDTNRGFEQEGWRSQTILHFINPIHDDQWVGQYFYGDRTGKSTQTLYIYERVDYAQYNFGLGLYKNFGNANARIGTTGNPVALDFWTASTYELGRSISDIIGNDAITPFLFVGGLHYNKKFEWQILARYTESTRSQEHSVAGSVGYRFDGGLRIGAKLEYYNDITKAGYKTGANGNTAGTPQNIADRSHAFAWIRYDF